MKRVGNDVVSLTDPANMRAPFRAGYLEKSCTPQEIEWVQRQDDRGEAFWQLWSAKEAAYKIGIKCGNPYHFLPKSLAVFPTGNYPAEKGYVDTGFGRVQIHWTIDPTFIHAIACQHTQIDDVFFAVFPLGNEDESILTHKRLLDAVARHHRIERDGLQLQWINQKIPQICREDLPLPMDCSMSHDGPWGAYAFTTYADTPSRL